MHESCREVPHRSRSIMPFCLSRCPPSRSSINKPSKSTAPPLHSDHLSPREGPIRKSKRLPFPIPTFKPDPSLKKLESEFLQEKTTPSRVHENSIRQACTAAHSFADCINDNNSADDDDEEDPFLRSIFRKKVEKPSKSTSIGMSSSPPRPATEVTTKEPVFNGNGGLTERQEIEHAQEPGNNHLPNDISVSDRGNHGLDNRQQMDVISLHHVPKKGSLLELAADSTIATLSNDLNAKKNVEIQSTRRAGDKGGTKKVSMDDTHFPYAKLNEYNNNDTTRLRLTSNPNVLPPEKSAISKCSIQSESPETKTPATDEGGSNCHLANTPFVRSCTAGIRKGRKRARTGLCALCTTCPCKRQNNAVGNDAVTTVTFARSQRAVEKALIRRVQKLEKTCEFYETQAEMVRKKLRQHRRDVWKTEGLLRQQIDTNHCTTDGMISNYRFLPDVRILEAPVEETATLSEKAVLKARRSTFSDTTCHQPTLTQMLGVPSRRVQRSREGMNGLAVPPTPDGIAESHEIGEIHSQGNIYTDAFVAGQEEEYHPYVCKTDPNDQVRRIQWVATSSNLGPFQKKCSIWQELLSSAGANHHDSGQELDKPPPKMGHSGLLSCAWDRLFGRNEAGPEEPQDRGLSQLLGLFNETEFSPVQPKYQEEYNSCPTSPESAIQLSMLSPPRKKMAIELIADIESNKDGVEILETACPNWKENVAFAMKQVERGNVVAALERIRKTRTMLLEQKQRCLQKWEEETYVLEVFERGLVLSLDRLQDS